MANLLDRFKNTFGFGEEDYDYEDYEELAVPEETREEHVVEVAPARSVRPRRSAGRSASTHGETNCVITVHEPLSYDESPLIADDLKAHKAVVLNFEQLDIEVKREIFDFVNGALYAIEGKIQKVNKDIFILAPPTVEIEGVKDELQKSGMFPW